MPKGRQSCVRSNAARIIKMKAASGKLHNPNKRDQQFAIAYSEARKMCGVGPYKKK